MRFGLFTTPLDIRPAAQSGFDYIELDVNDILALSEEEYIQMMEELHDTGLRVEVLRGILPDDFRVIGEATPSRDISEALDHTAELARIFGCDTLVFDCPRLRRLPEGLDPSIAWRQLGNFMRRLQSFSISAGARIAVMPIRRSVCDMIRRLPEAAMIPSILDLSNIGVCASLMNMTMEAETPTEFRSLGNRLLHITVCDAIGNRLPRKGDGMNYERMFTVLSGIGYDSRITCEGYTSGQSDRLHTALDYLKSCAG